MKYIQIDKFNGTATIVSNPNGEALIFDNLTDAQNSLAGNCKDGIVVPLGNFIKTLSNCADFVSIIKSEEGEELGGNLEKEINAFLN